ncbi:MAG: FtsB family cell division protein [Caldilineaceae bacterium]|jgi:cell division protein DivIC
MTTSKRNPRLLWAIVLSLALLFVVTYGERLATKANLAAALVEQQARISEARQRQQALQQQLVYVRSDAYIEEAARNDLGMVQPGDELLIVVEGKSATTAASDALAPTTTDEPSLLQTWLKRLGF